MASSTIFKQFNIPIADKSLILITKDIREGKYKAEVEQVRSAIQVGKKDEADRLKKQLPAFTPSATFQGGRKMEHLVSYSQFIILDFDKLTPEQLQSAFDKASAIPYTFSCFRSPSGNGIKILVEVNTGLQEHKHAWQQVADYYQKEIGLVTDPSGKDVTRLCFMSYDPEAYKNINNKVFEVAPISDVPLLEEELKPEKTQTPVSKYQERFQHCIDFTNQKSQYHEGNRNNYIHLLTCNCNRSGIPEADALELITASFDLDPKEIHATVESVYANQRNEFAKFANTAKPQTPSVETVPEDFLKNTPSVPAELYDLMPPLIRGGAAAFTDFREKDVFLTGALAILSGCLPGVKGLYAGQEVFPNLFSFTVAPAASGKGVLKFAKMLADEYHAFVLKASRDAETQYNVELAEHKQRMHSKKKGDTSTEEQPVKPAFKVVYIPANTSYAKILWHLEQNEGMGIICETEADTLGNVFKQEWGSYSDMLRKSFHHERISSSRKTNNEFTEVNAPCLSIALSGTPNQVTGLIASAEDGLFSRFLFYAFKVEQQWKDVSPNANSINLTEHFKQLSLHVFQMVQFLQREETFVSLTQSQWSQLNRQCEAWLNDITMFTAEEAASIVKRLGLILYRIAMLFTALRKFDNGEAALQVVCTDEDFNTALQLAEVYLHHSILMFNNLPRQGEVTQFRTGDNKRKFYEALPEEFTRQQAVELGKTFSLSARTVDDILHNATGKMLSKIKAGSYRKV
jgi:VirE N-terminal domain.